MAEATLTISSKNYSAWALRGWLLCKMAGLKFDEEMLPWDDPSVRAELMLLSPSFLVPKLTHKSIEIWDTLAIAEYLREAKPKARLFPTDPVARAHCRAICGEMHSGFANLRSALPMNLKASYPSFKVWAGAQADIDRITAIWRACLESHGGPFLYGEKPTAADAMYAPVATRFTTYSLKLDPVCEAYRVTIMDWEPLKEWIEAAKAEPDEMEELDVEF